MKNTLSDSALRIQDLLATYNLNLKVITFPELTRTAQQAAIAVGCDVGQIAKTILFKTKTTSQLICVITSGKNKVDENKIEHYLGEKIEKADAHFILTHTGFVIGGVPPIGYPLINKPFILLR